jgi:hypothetical protein
MSPIGSGAHRSRCLSVLPGLRGTWVVVSERAVLSEHLTATGAENAALARLPDGDELLILDRYHRCRRRARPQPTRSWSRPQTSRQG